MSTTVDRVPGPTSDPTDDGADGAPRAETGPTGVGPVRTSLTRWTLHVRGPLDAVPEAARAALADGLDVDVPATALAALVAAGLAGDVTVDATEEEVAWVAATAWEYRARVPRPRATQARLVLEGVDTVGRVLVDGVVRLEVADMFHRHVLDLSADLAGGEDAADAWDVRVQVDPALPVADAAEAANPLPRADIYELPYNQIRKMACSFGWDWGPVTVSAGLWRPVVLEAWDGPRLEDVHLRGGWDGAARLTLRARTTAEGGDVVVRVSGTDGAPLGPDAVVPVVDGSAVAEVPVAGARPWQPVGLGSQPLYDVVVELRDGDGTVVDRTVRRLGFRSVVARQAADAVGSSFALEVNGRRVWVRGFNWIPPHVLPETVTKDHLRHLVDEAVEAGANLLRVWGGGIVETDDFYDVCDEAGVLVWQDFPFACAAYPEDEVTAAHVRDEVVDAVRRVGHRTSLVLWCGCNENLWGYEDWGWKDVLDGRPWGARYYHELLPQALAELDGSRPYVPGSPFSPGDQHPNDTSVGTTHHWDTWNQLDYTAFEEKTTRFAAEFGWQAPAGWPTLVRALGGEPTGADDPRLVRLQKAYQGMESLQRGVLAHLPEPQDGRSWFLATQLVQARAVRASIGRFRSLHDRCSGAVWWQLDDCWPALSWAVLDVTGRRKLAWYAMREVLSARAVLPTADGDAHGLTLVNDVDEPWAVPVRVSVVTRDGQVLAQEQRQVEVAALGHAVVRPDAVPDGADAVVVDAGDRRAVRWLSPDLDLGTASAAVELDVTAADVEGLPAVALTVTAVDLVRDLVVLAETDPRLDDVVVDDQLRTLLPGESLTVIVSGARVGELGAEEWGALLAATGPVTVR